MIPSSCSDIVFLDPIWFDIAPKTYQAKTGELRPVKRSVKGRDRDYLR